MFLTGDGKKLIFICIVQNSIKVTCPQVHTYTLPELEEKVSFLIACLPAPCLFVNTFLQNH